MEFQREILENSHKFYDLGKEKIVELLINNGTSVSVIDDQGRTPLHVAAKHGNEIRIDWEAN